MEKKSDDQQDEGNGLGLRLLWPDSVPLGDAKLSYGSDYLKKLPSHTHQLPFSQSHHPRQHCLSISDM